MYLTLLEEHSQSLDSRELSQEKARQSSGHVVRHSWSNHITSAIHEESLSYYLGHWPHRCQIM